MNYAEHFAEELSNPRTQYFIFDSKGESGHTNVDFVQYHWHRSRYNLVKEGDLFLYRRPQSSSATHKFYIFGAAKVETTIGDDLVIAKVAKPYPFQEYLHPEDLEAFQWEFKPRGATWSNFFNQLGMTKITKRDFVGLFQLSAGTSDSSDYDPQAATDAAQAMQRNDFSADDEEGTRKFRSKHRVFSNKVKTNYNNQCALCDIRTRPFLVGSHIVPWADRKETRLDPSNGICLCSLHDRAFDAGYLTIDEDYHIVVTTHVDDDAELASLLAKVRGKRLREPLEAAPKEDFLAYHRTERFERWTRKQGSV